MARPQNVRVIKSDGSVVMCELALTRTEADGTEIWSVATALDHDDQLRIGLLPEGVSIVAPIDTDEGDRLTVRWRKP